LGQKINRGGIQSRRNLFFDQIADYTS
jgi:hypothetical protein